MKKLTTILMVLVFMTASSFAINWTNYLMTTAPNPNDTFLTGSAANNENNQVSWRQLFNWTATNAAAQNPSNFVTSAITNGAVIITNSFSSGMLATVQNTNGLVAWQLPARGTTINPSKTPHFQAAVRSSRAVRVMLLGDSVMSYATGGPILGLQAAFYDIVPPRVSYGGIASFNGFPSIIANANALALGGFVNTDNTNFISYYSISNSAAITNLNWIGHPYAATYGGDNADSGVVYWVAEPQAGSFTISDSQNVGGTWTVIATINASNSVWGLGVTNFTLDPTLKHNLLITGTGGGISNCVKYIGCGYFYQTNANSTVYETFSYPGRTVFNGWLTAGTNLTIPLLRSLNPDLICINEKNETAASLIANLPAFTSLLTNTLPNADLAWTLTTAVTNSPLQQAQYDVPFRNSFIYANALLNNQFCFDAYNFIGTNWNLITALNWTGDSFGVHLNQFGGQAWGQAEMAELLYPLMGGFPTSTSITNFQTGGVQFGLANASADTFTLKLPAGNFYFTGGASAVNGILPSGNNGGFSLLGGSYRFADPTGTTYNELNLNSSGAVFGNGIPISGNGIGLTNMLAINLAGAFTNITSSRIITATNGFVSYANHIPAAVTVGSSPWSFTNTTTSTLNSFLTDAAAYSVTLNGVSIYGSLVGNSSVPLSVGSYITITYLTTTPTMATNSW